MLFILYFTRFSPSIHQRERKYPLTFRVLIDLVSIPILQAARLTPDFVEAWGRHTRRYGPSPDKDLKLRLGHPQCMFERNPEGKASTATEQEL